VSVAHCISFILFCCVPSLRDHVVGVGDFIVCAESTAIICVDDFIDFMSNTHGKKKKARFYCGKLISCFLFLYSLIL